MEKILRNFSVKDDKKWNLRFYVLMNECFKKWLEIVKERNKESLPRFKSVY